jgi:hypothetical protein
LFFLFYSLSNNYEWCFTMMVARWSFRQIIQQIEWTFARNLNRSLAAKEHVQDVAVVLLRRLYHRVLLGSVFAKWHLYTNLIVNLGGGGNGGVGRVGGDRGRSVQEASVPEASMLPSMREVELELEKTTIAEYIDTVER